MSAQTFEQHDRTSGTSAGRRTAHLRFGAVPGDGGTAFTVFAPRDELQLRILGGAAAGIYPLERKHDGLASVFIRGAAAGDRYEYLLRGERRPDPASRFQPDGVHGPSEIVDAGAYRWRSRWQGLAPEQLVLYELHVGTFTADGTFDAARRRMGALRELGVTAIELMPVADFAGARNWGYDGVCLYAPARCYGRPDDLRALVDAAHEAGLGVILDVVYNHLGPDGAYLPQFNRDYITTRHETPWGGAVNLDGPGSDLVRAFIIDNALHWIREYRLDGLRLDATHALIDASPRHLVAELADEARRAAAWPVVVHAEDHRNMATMIDAPGRGGWGLDGVWADDFHHVVRRRLAGDAHGYYEDFAGSCAELACILRQGWLFTGQYSRHMRERRGTDPSAVPMQRFVVCLQNHDQVGNRATGDRLHHAIDVAAWRAASVVLLTSPMTPLLFMGQEWAASTPFQYFTDLEPELGVLVTEGRRREFKDFPEFADPAARERIPDPQAASTFEACKLNWDEREAGPHAATLALYTELLRLRRAHAALAADAAATADASALDDATLLVQRGPFRILARLDGAGAAVVPGHDAPPEVVLSTEDARFAPGAQPIDITVDSGRLVVRFPRAGAVILRVA